MLNLRERDLISWQGFVSDSSSECSSVGGEVCDLKKADQDKTSEVFHRKMVKRWSKAEEEVVKEAFRKYNAENPQKPAYSSPCASSCNVRSVYKISKYPEVALLGRSSKQIREKWINDLCPNSLGHVIKKSHKEILNALYKIHGKRWEVIAKVFAGNVYQDKPDLKYYSSGAIRSYFLNCAKKVERQDRKSMSLYRNVDSITETAKKALAPRNIVIWSKEEEEVLTKAFRKYSDENSKELVDLGPYEGDYNRSVFSVIASYPEVALWGRSPKQIREKWINDLCPSCLGTQIREESHIQIIESLHQVHGRQWGVIAKFFAEEVLTDKPKGFYYSSNAIKNFCLKNKKRKRDQYEESVVANLNTYSSEGINPENKHKRP